jgi:hypothetical protein
MGHVTTFQTELPNFQDLPLLAQVGTRLGARWRRVGTVRRAEGQLCARFSGEAAIFEPLWSVRRRAASRDGVCCPAIRFAALVDGRFVRELGACHLDSAALRLL